jgi:hypothetical protein
VFVGAEMVQIDTTLKLEFESSKRSWLDLLNTAGMRRRAFITSFLGLFTQFSGNTLISYYLGDLLEMFGRTESTVKQKVNLVNACWNLVCGFTIAMLVRRFKRRTMYLTCALSLVTVYVCWTISMERAVTAREAGRENKAAGGAVIVFIFLYAPAYNIGYNALTYSKWSSLFISPTLANTYQLIWSNCGHTLREVTGSPCSSFLGDLLGSLPPL